jgi:predicted metal-dependent HD superfamily phosphohydrolase
MNDFITQQFSSYNLFQAAGDVVELNAWVHDDIIDQIKQLNEDPTQDDVKGVACERISQDV